MNQVAPSPSKREYALAVIAGFTLAFTAWSMGGMLTWSFHVLAAGGALTCLIALMPLPAAADGPHRAASGSPVRRLLTWPAFYFSLAFLIYILIGAFNPMGAKVEGEAGWWVVAVEAPLGLSAPTSVRAEYDPMNVWRSIVGFGGSFALMWGLWAGLTRRTAALALLWCFLLSGAAMGFVAMLQHFTEADKVLWHFKSANPLFWGSFFYRNHGAAFLNLVLVVSGFLFFYHARKAARRGRSGGPHFLCFLLFATVASSVGLALSRGGILFALLLSLCFLTLVAVVGLRSFTQVSSRTAALIPCALLIIGAFTLVRYIDVDAIEQRFGDIEATIQNADQDARMLSSKATWDMAQERLWWGWGAGSFRYVFPLYQQHYPEIFHRYYHRGRQEWVGRTIYHYAHNDLVQFLAEYGIIGSCFLWLSILSIVASLLRHIDRAPLGVIFLGIGLAAAFAHAFIEFTFSNPAYWFALIAVFTLSAKLLALETARRRG